MSFTCKVNTTQSFGEGKQKMPMGKKKVLFLKPYYLSNHSAGVNSFNLITLFNLTGNNSGAYKEGNKVFNLIAFLFVTKVIRF